MDLLAYREEVTGVLLAVSDQLNIDLNDVAQRRPARVKQIEVLLKPYPYVLGKMYYRNRAQRVLDDFMQAEIAPSWSEFDWRACFDIALPELVHAALADTDFIDRTITTEMPAKDCICILHSDAMYHVVEVQCGIGCYRFSTPSITEAVSRYLKHQWHFLYYPPCYVTVDAAGRQGGNNLQEIV